MRVVAIETLALIESDQLQLTVVVWLQTSKSVSRKNVDLIDFILLELEVCFSYGWRQAHSIQFSYTVNDLYLLWHCRIQFAFHAVNSV